MKAMDYSNFNEMKGQYVEFDKILVGIDKKYRIES